MSVEKAALEILKKAPLLQGVADNMLNDLIKESSMVIVNDGDCVIREGEFGDTFYAVLSGEFAVEIYDDDGTQKEVARMKEGAIFGQLAMMGRGQRNATIRCATMIGELLEVSRGPFQKLIKQKPVADRLEEDYRREVISKFVRENEYLRGLSDADKNKIIEQGKLNRFEAMKDVYKAGDPAKTFYFVRQGFLKAWRVEGETENILAYLRDKDFFGDLELLEPQPRVATVTTMEPVEIVELSRTLLAELYQRYPETIKKFRRYESSRRSQMNDQSSGSQTSMLFIGNLIETGVAQARSALVINMDICTRCGNCVQSCSDLHDGYSRLIRRGKKLTRREKNSQQLEHVFFPNSCMHCRTPECMRGCPTGAIARDKEGEVYIRDFCIGCGQCSKDCEFGNISMITLRDASGNEQKKAASNGKRRAVKCDICKDYSYPNCVYNCPQAAILRVRPSEYFEELRDPISLVSMAQS